MFLLLPLFVLSIDKQKTKSISLSKYVLYTFKLLHSKLIYSNFFNYASLY